MSRHMVIICTRKMVKNMVIICTRKTANKKRILHGRLGMQILSSRAESISHKWAKRVMLFLWNIIWSLFSLKEFTSKLDEGVDIEAIYYSAKGCAVKFFSVWRWLLLWLSRKECMEYFPFVFLAENCNCQLTVSFYAPLFELSGWEELNWPAIFALKFFYHYGLFCLKFPPLLSSFMILFNLFTPIGCALNQFLPSTDAWASVLK